MRRYPEEYDKEGRLMKWEKEGKPVFSHLKLRVLEQYATQRYILSH